MASRWTRALTVALFAGGLCLAVGCGKKEGDANKGPSDCEATVAKSIECTPMLNEDQKAKLVKKCNKKKDKPKYQALIACTKKESDCDKWNQCLRDARDAHKKAKKAKKKDK